MNTLTTSGERTNGVWNANTLTCLRAFEHAEAEPVHPQPALPLLSAAQPGSEHWIQSQYSVLTASYLKHVGLTKTKHFLCFLDKEIILAMQWCQRSDFKSCQSQVIN